MKPWMMALMTRKRVLRSQTFTANGSWTAPFATTQLESASGEGADGIPGYTRDGYTYTERAESQGRLRGTGTWVVLATSSGSGFSTSIPTDSCGPIVTSGDATYDAYRSCSYYTDISAGTETVPPTTGASTTGFGKTFPGGTGGAATVTTFNNVAVTSTDPYSIVVPSGGSLTITYYE